MSASPTTATVNVAHIGKQTRQVSPPEPLYLRAISPDLPVQRTSHQYADEAQTFIPDYKADESRRPIPTRLPPPRSDDKKTGGGVPVSTARTTGAGKTCVARVKFPRTHEWKRVNHTLWQPYSG